MCICILYCYLTALWHNFSFFFTFFLRFCCKIAILLNSKVFQNYVKRGYTVQAFFLLSEVCIATELKWQLKCLMVICHLYFHVILPIQIFKQRSKWIALSLLLHVIRCVLKSNTGEKVKRRVWRGLLEPSCRLTQERLGLELELGRAHKWTGEGGKMSNNCESLARINQSVFCWIVSLLFFF